MTHHEAVREALGHGGRRSIALGLGLREHLQHVGILRYDPAVTIQRNRSGRPKLRREVRRRRGSILLLKSADRGSCDAGGGSHRNERQVSPWRSVGVSAKIRVPNLEYRLQIPLAVHPAGTHIDRGRTHSSKLNTSLGRASGHRNERQIGTARHPTANVSDGCGHFCCSHAAQRDLHQSQHSGDFTARQIRGDGKHRLVGTRGQHGSQESHLTYGSESARHSRSDENR